MTVVSGVEACVGCACVCDSAEDVSVWVDVV